LIVIVVERVKPSLRGKLTRWLLEVHPGVFVGTVSARVRARLWTLVNAGKGAGACSLIHRAPNEQGFVLETQGNTLRRPIDFDGLCLLKRLVPLPVKSSVQAVP
jgi:CRISPR-associated protein Cas2